ncbi:hypothetical protein [Cellulomonas sp.]|uniref:hypothetical protein n=1 Tax=Cellulomonas sp. TaxID=40001 RepID=UPI00281111E8|nr:hypothetical protein [Cellulomonas sp.]
MTATTLVERVVTAQQAGADRAPALPRGAVPCAARPGTALRHVDGPCLCFVGGPPPEFAPSGGRPTG